MIQTILRREYQLSCDGCSEAAPAKATTEQAVEWAHTEGWQAVKTVSGCGFLTTWFCPRCQRQREAS
jgi:hypothetical protein